jgi:hypothetical protein
VNEYSTISIQNEQDFIRNLDSIKVDRDLLTNLEGYCGTAAKKILAISGLRRTGKTVLMMRQALNLINAGRKAAYFLCSRKTTQRDLFLAVSRAVEEGYSHIFIDEITYVDGFADWADWIYNTTVVKGCHCIIAGTDSYGLLLAHNRVLYDRIDWVKTTYMSFAEFNRVTGGDIFRYIRHGGVFSDVDVRDYVNTSVVDNIVHSFQRYDASNHDMLDDLSAAEIKTMLIKIIVRISFRATVGLFRKKYGHADVSLPQRNLLKRDPSFFLENEELIKGKAEAFFGITEDLSRFKDKQLEVFAVYFEDILQRLDVIMPCEHIVEGVRRADGRRNYMLTQSALRYQLTNVYLRILDEVGGEGSETLSVSMQENVEGQLMEAVVLTETEKRFGSRTLGEPEHHRAYDIVKLDGLGFEFDMVALCIRTGILFLCEVKRSSRVEPEQCKYLRDEAAAEKAMHIMLSRNPYGSGVKQVHKCVLYNGEGYRDGDIEYINTERFLLELAKTKHKSLAER